MSKPNHVTIETRVDLPANNVKRGSGFKQLCYALLDSASVAGHRRVHANR